MANYHFTNSFADEMQNHAYSFVLPTPVSKPSLIAWSDSVAKILGISKDDEAAQIFSGNKILPGMKPIATRYGGHQFGHWAGQLGDGRAIILGELNGHEIQLKGAGLTPYSRRGDGRAVLRSSVREYLCSEAIHNLGIATTRALALVDSGDGVVRDMFYDGNPQVERGAICTRVAPSFLRFGHFEILAADGDREALQQLLDYTLKFYPGHNCESFFDELSSRTAKLISEWMRVGFVHGVMNTDNMSVLGLTIDYGPYGWLDVYDPSWTPNTTDAEYRRYRFENQASIALWNLERLAAALRLLGYDLTTQLIDFKKYFTNFWQAMMTQKLGLNDYNRELVEELDALMRKQETDMTNFYRELSKCIKSGMPQNCFYNDLTHENCQAWSNWLDKWRSQLKYDLPENIEKNMNKVNPSFILRNYLAYEAIEGLLQNDRSQFDRLKQALLNPYDEAPADLVQKQPTWARHKNGCSALSCSS